MRRLKTFELLKKRESVLRQKTISQLNEVSADAEKCRNIRTELDKLLKEKHFESHELNANSFITDRHLIHKMMDQKEILENRLEYLETERLAAIADLDKSKEKLKVFEKRRLELKVKQQSALELKKDENANLSRKAR